MEQDAIIQDGQLELELDVHQYPENCVKKMDARHVGKCIAEQCM